MTTVMCFGTFDLLHLGHINYFEQAKKHGTKLIVVIARDTTKQKQNKTTLFTEQERIKLVQSLEIVDEAVLGYPDNHFRIIQEKKPEVLCLGYDHPVKEEELVTKLYQLNLFPKITRMNAYKQDQHKSSILKEKIFKNII